MKYEIGDVVRFVTRGYNERQQVGMTATVRALDYQGRPIVSTDDDGESLGWSDAVEFVSREEKHTAIDERIERLRDEFAMAALTGLIAHSGAYADSGLRIEAARLSYSYADAMMEARK